MAAQCGCGGGQPASTDFQRAVHWGPVQWAGLGVISEPQQKGRWGEAILSKRFANFAGVQRRSLGYVPHTWMDVPTPAVTLQSSRAPGIYPGAQRFGSQVPDGRLTPWMSAQLMGSVAARQAQHSGLAALRFTRALIDANRSAA